MVLGEFEGWSFWLNVSVARVIRSSGGLLTYPFFTADEDHQQFGTTVKSATNKNYEQE